MCVSFFFLSFIFVIYFNSWYILAVLLSFLSKYFHKKNKKKKKAKKINNKNTLVLFFFLCVWRCFYTLNIDRQYSIWFLISIQIYIYLQYPKFGVALLYHLIVLLLKQNLHQLLLCKWERIYYGHIYRNKKYERHEYRERDLYMCIYVCIKEVRERMWQVVQQLKLIINQSINHKNLTCF